MILTVYRILMRLLTPALYVLLAIRTAQGREEPDHVAEKRGIASLARPAGRLIWIHAASNGEMLSTLPLLRKILKANTDVTCLVTTVTVTAAELTRRQNNPHILHQYAPLDHPGWVARFMDHWKPDMVLWVESELWPATLSDIHDRRIPLAMINGRLSDRSARRWQKLPRTIGRIVSWFDVTLAQSTGDAVRLKSIGASAAVAAGNIKYAAAPLPVDATALAALQAQIGTRPVLLFASTHGGEEEIAVSVHQAITAQMPDLLTIIMPRHPGRGDDIMKTLAGINAARRSIGEPITVQTQIYLADTLGEAGLFYKLSPVVFVGNSLITVPGGGHNVLEPAHMDCAILYGPHMWNFSEIEPALRRAGGSIMVQDAQDLAAQAAVLLRDETRRRALANAATSFVAAQDRVLDDVIHHLQPLFGRAEISL